MKNVLTAFLVVITIILAGCAGNAPYRRSLPVYPNDNTQRPTNGVPAIDPATTETIETNGGFNIGYVEFDDQGWFWSHQQWKRVKDEINKEADAATNGLTMIVFVHGWKNNADFNCDNVKLFRTVLTNVATALSPRKVMGIYVGWRGLTLDNDYFPIPGGKEMTIYNRKNTALRIGHQGCATQVFTELECMQDEFNQRAEFQTKGNRAELIIIGHSFGGQLVYAAISQILTERLVHAAHEQRERPIRSLGDLVVLLNPAFEASFYNNLISLASSPDIKYPPDQAPVLAILRSESDSATGWLFTSGMNAAYWNEATRPSKGKKEEWLFNVKKQPTENERTAITHSVGNDDAYVNYDLYYADLAKVNSDTNKLNIPLQALKKSHAPPRKALKDNFNFNQSSDYSKLEPLVFPHGTNFAYVLIPRHDSEYVRKPGNPFFNIAVDPEIMNGHGDIANPKLLLFLSDFISLNRTNYLEQTSPTTYSQANAAR